MSAFTPLGRELMLTSILVPERLVRLDVVWLALSTEIVDPMSPSSLVEPSGNGYQRAPYRTGDEWWVPSGYGEYVNSKEIVWEPATGPWGPLQGWALMMGSTGSQTLAGGSLSLSTSTVVDGWSVKLPALSLRLGQTTLR